VPTYRPDSDLAHAHSVFGGAMATYRFTRTVMRPRRPVSQPLEPLLLEPVAPLVERGTADPVVTARLGDIAGHLFSMLQHRPPVVRYPSLLSLRHRFSLSSENPDVNNLCQFHSSGSLLSTSSPLTGRRIRVEISLETGRDN